MLKAHHSQLQLRSWSPIDNDVYPLLLNKNPTKYQNACCSFLVPKTNRNYLNLSKLIQAWLIDVKPGKKMNINICDKFNFDDLGPKDWYVIDLRSDPDESFTNKLTIENWNKATAYQQQNLLIQIYKATKFMVIFADELDHISQSLISLSVLALTSDQSTLKINELLFQGTYHTPQDHTVIKSFSPDEKYQQDLLVGYHRFEPFQTFCYWPASF